MSRSKAVHILGIAGTFMAGIAAIARESGIEVSGADAGVYPPMSTLLEELGIRICDGYRAADIPADTPIIIGNALSRGNEAVESILNQNFSYTSGPQWLHEQVLCNKTVLAVAGTHGKTTTASMLAWILHSAGKQGSPGYLIGGKPGNFSRSARLGDSDHFVIEADEYDTAFFDKRSKFIHYHPRIAILNNLEFDHADIFADLNAIKTQFHHLIRTIPQNGKLIVNADDPNLPEVIERGCWTPVETFSTRKPDADWYARLHDQSGTHFTVQHDNARAEVNWQGMGEHNMQNALAAIAAACQTGIELVDACHALSEFRFPAKRLQSHPTLRGFQLFEDFAHHPTAIKHTLETLSRAYPGKRLIALLELRSNTMQMGIHRDTLAPALGAADLACVVNPEASTWSLANSAEPDLHEFYLAEQCFDFIQPQLRADDLVVVMSNGNFTGIIKRLVKLPPTSS